MLRTVELSYSELLDIKAVEYCTERCYNTGRFQKSLDMALSASGLMPFEFFSGLYRCIEKAYGAYPSLPADTVRELFYRYARALPGVDETLLLSCLRTDRLESSRDVHLPAFLRNDFSAGLDTAVSSVFPDWAPSRRYYHAEYYAVSPFQGVLSPCIAVYDYRVKNPVTGLYTVTARSL